MSSNDHQTNEGINGFLLSPQQRRLWLLQRDGKLRVSHAGLRISGELDPERLRRALGEVVARHESLRTSFHHVPGIKTPLQTPIAGDALRWRSADAGEPVFWSRSRERDLEQESFDLEHGPSLHAALLKLGPNDHLLTVCTPAMCTDQISLRLLFEEAWAAYRGELEQLRPASELVQYVQYAEWQNQLLDDIGESKDGRVFWERFRDRGLHAPQLALLEHGGTLAGSSRVGFALDLRAPLQHALERVVSDHGAAPGLVLLAAYAALLRRLTGELEIVIPHLFDGRKFEELKGSIGLFERWIPIRCQLDAATSLSGLLFQLGDAVQEAHAWQELYEPAGLGTPEDELKKLWAAFAFSEPQPPPSSEAAEIRVEWSRCNNEHFALELRAGWMQGRLRLEWRHDPDELASGALRQLATQYLILLGELVGDPERPVDRCRLLSAAQSHELVVEHNDTRRTFPHDCCAHELFAAQRRRTPEAIAVAFRERQMTYAELDSWANRIAHRLRALGVGTEEIVAVHLERSIELLPALLGVLKAGAAYLPLAPSAPLNRLRFMVEEAGVRWVLSRRGDELSTALGAMDVRTIDPALEEPTIAAASDSEPSPRARAESLAYVLYTSGSTGRPKGVMVQHRGLTHYLSWCLHDYLASGTGGSLMHSPIDFDLSVTALFLPLLSGGQVMMIPEDAGLESLVGTLTATPFEHTLLKLTPSHLMAANQLLRWSEMGTRAATLVIGGEALSAELLAPWRQHAPHVRLINEYGPTETVVGCVTYEIHSGAPSTGFAPIGRPIANTRVYLLDDHLQPVVVGSLGELFVAGAGVSRGYLGRPAETAARFLPAPWAEHPGERMYRTGDLARWLAGEGLVFVGRRDHQVKIRGSRIELGEVQAALVEHPAMLEAVIVSREERLVAYLIPAPGGAVPETEELRSFLRERLTEPMIPSHFVRLSALPLTPNGKIDRDALPAPERETRSLAAYVAPENDVERKIVEVWCEVLQVDKVGRYDNFFDLGGHSLFMVQVYGRLKAVFETDLSMVELFEYPTVSAMAKRLAGTVSEGDFQSPRERARDRREKLALRARQRAALPETTT